MVSCDGETMTYRVRWTLIDRNSYEAWSEIQGPKGWVTMLTLTMKQSS